MIVESVEPCIVIVLAFSLSLLCDFDLVDTFQLICNRHIYDFTPARVTQHSAEFLSCWFSITFYQYQNRMKRIILKAPMATKVVCFFHSAEMFKKLLWQTVWTQIRLFWSGSTMLASILKLVSNVRKLIGRRRLQQTLFFRCIFSWRFKG